MIIPKQSKKFRVICTLTCLDNIKCESTSTQILGSWYWRSNIATNINQYQEE